jgi:hypothetical protein
MIRNISFDPSLTVCGVALWLGVIGGCGNSTGIRRDGAAPGGATASGGGGAQGGSSGGAGAGGGTASPECRVDKVSFSQATGCQNDGFVEFCLPANDNAALSQVMSIDATIVCHQGSRGRADCKPETEQLCQLPTHSQCPIEGPMPDALWLDVCRLAAVDAVAKIVPTWYE